MSKERTSFYKFIQDMCPEAGNYQDNWHVGGLADHLQAVTEGHIRKMTIFLSSRGRAIEVHKQGKKKDDGQRQHKRN